MSTGKKASLIVPTYESSKKKRERKPTRIENWGNLKMECEQIFKKIEAIEDWIREQDPKFIRG